MRRNDKSELDRGRADVLWSRVRELKHWRHRIDLGNGVVTPGSEDCQRDLLCLRLPENMTNMRVLDIGCSDGFYSFECERRGAKVVAIDDLSSLMNPGKNGFALVRELIGSSAVFQRASVLDLEAATLGRFDLVLFLNVLYHLKHPLLALERIAGVLNPEGQLYLKSYFWQDFRLKVRGRGIGFDWSRRPRMRFYPSTELAEDPTNWWAPNRRCIEAMLETSGFTIEEDLGIFGDRIYYRARLSKSG